MTITFEEKYRNLKNNRSITPVQEEGINFLLSRTGAVLSFQTGLGKTLTALTTAKILLDTFDSARVVIVCPVRAKKAFKSEMKKSFDLPRDYVGYISTDEMEFDRYHNKIFLFTDTNIKKYYSLVEDLVSDGHKIVLMVDEAHGLADKKSEFHKVMSKVKSMSIITYLITATPLINSLDGLYNIVNFACPKFLGKKVDFDNRYTKWHLESIYVKGGTRKKIKVLDGYQNLDELNQRLKQVMIVRGKTYNLKFGKHFSNMTDAEHTVYEKVSSGLISGNSEERNFSKRLHDLQRFIDRAYEGDAEIVELAKSYGASHYSTKEENLISAIKAALSKKFSIIVYSSYKSTVSRLHNVLKSRRVELGVGRVYEITGSVDIKTREKIEDRINDNDIILVSDAGTESINLQRCNCIILYDIPFSVKSVIQLIGRICRIDTKHDAQYIIFCGVNDSIDEYKYALMQMHLGAVQRAINVGTDIPLGDLEIDNEYIKSLREKLLWKYKGDPVKKKLRKVKRELKGKIEVASVEEAKSIMAPNKFLIEPIQIEEGTDIKVVPSLFPDMDRYKGFVEGKIPFTVLRSDYLKYLRDNNGRVMVQKLQTGIRNSSGNFVIVGNTKLPEVLRDEILDQFVI